MSAEGQVSRKNSLLEDEGGTPVVRKVMLWM